MIKKQREKAKRLKVLRRKIRRILKENSSRNLKNKIKE